MRKMQDTCSFLYYFWDLRLKKTLFSRKKKKIMCLGFPGCCLILHMSNTNTDLSRPPQVIVLEWGSAHVPFYEELDLSL